MQDKELKQLGALVKKVGNYKPTNPPKKPSKQPSKKELEQIYVFDGNKINAI